MDYKVALITGGNAGIGFSVADRLLTDHDNLHVCLACRNRERAENAKQSLLKRHPGSEVSVVIIDTSCMKSMFAACKEIKTRFKRLDYLYLNAAIMTVTGINLSKIVGILSGQAAKILSTGHGVLMHENNVTPEGLPQVFATNLFGHYVMVRELEDSLGGTNTTVIVWTSSENADKDALHLDDIQHRYGSEPYSSSKYAMDVLSVALNDKLNKKGVYLVTTCPGLVMTGLTYNILPFWIWVLVTPFLFFMRLFVARLTHSPYNGAEALVWVAKQEPELLDPRTKYLSNCSVLGRPYVGRQKLCIEDQEMTSLCSQLEDLYQSFKQSCGTSLDSQQHCNGSS